VDRPSTGVSADPYNATGSDDVRVTRDMFEIGRFSTTPLFIRVTAAGRTKCPHYLKASARDARNHKLHRVHWQTLQKGNFQKLRILRIHGRSLSRQRMWWKLWKSLFASFRKWRDSIWWILNFMQDVQPGNLANVSCAPATLNTAWIVNFGPDSEDYRVSNPDCTIARVSDLQKSIHREK
jgi:hypothetical protein